MVRQIKLTILRHLILKVTVKGTRGPRRTTYWLLFAEGHLNRRLFGDMLRKIWALPVPGG